MLKVLNVCQRVLIRLGKVESLCLAGAGIALVLIVGVGIAARYTPVEFTSVMASPIEELSKLTLVWLVFWGASWVHREDSHYKMTVLLDHLGRRTRAVLFIVDNLIIIGFSLFLIIYAVQLMKSNLDTVTLVMQWPVNWWTSGLLAGMVLILIYTIRRLILEIRGLMRA